MEEPTLTAAEAAALVGEAVDKVRSWYPSEVFCPTGSSQDCLSARMAKLTACNVEKEAAASLEAWRQGILNKAQADRLEVEKRWRQGVQEYRPLLGEATEEETLAALDHQARLVAAGQLSKIGEQALEDDLEKEKPQEWRAPTIEESRKLYRAYLEGLQQNGNYYQKVMGDIGLQLLNYWEEKDRGEVEDDLDQIAQEAQQVELHPQLVAAQGAYRARLAELADRAQKWWDQRLTTQAKYLLDDLNQAALEPSREELRQLRVQDAHAAAMLREEETAELEEMVDAQRGCLAEAARTAEKQEKELDAGAHRLRRMLDQLAQATQKVKEQEKG